jgi:hypothetical protein
LLETQEALTMREREKTLRSEMSRVQAELEKEKTRAAEAMEKVNCNELGGSFDCP